MPQHDAYLKEFRVEQCPLFLQHKCTQHRPFTCFHWHFMNQRRRRPLRRRDGTFNYSADNYCTKYDETTGICPDGDDCPYLHRTAGDTERRYHLRYYKTCMCVHDTDARGYCVKNGIHCAFAHGSHDHRPPVYDIKEIQALEAAEADGCVSLNGPNALDKERNLMNEDPKWQDTNYVLSNYKTEPCKRPPRLCRQGYACPQYHNSKDKRRSPRKFKYRSTPCPNVKHGEEWGEPGNCDVGDMCSYCHTRTEQQFHPEIYKSTKCNDVQQAGYCPRGVFCAFAHVELSILEELSRDHSTSLELGSSLAEILCSALPQPGLDKKDKSSDSSNGSSDVSESDSTSSLGSNSSHNKAPGSQLTHNKVMSFQRLSTMDLTKQFLAIDNDPTLDAIDREQKKQSLCLRYNSMQPFYGTGNESVDSVVGNALDELHLDDALHLSALDRDPLDARDSPTVLPHTVQHQHQHNTLSMGLANSAVASGLLGSSAPVNIPGAARSSFANAFSSPTGGNNSPLHHQHHLHTHHQQHSSVGALGGIGSGTSAATAGSFLGGSGSARFSHPEQSHMDMFLGHSSSQQQQGRPAAASFFDFHHSSLSPSGGGNGGAPGRQPQNSAPSIGNHHTNFSISPSLGSTNLGQQLELVRLRDELTTLRLQVVNYEERALQARNACDAWQRESDDANRKAQHIEAKLNESQATLRQLRDEMEAVQQMQSSGPPHLHRVVNVTELGKLSIGTLKTVQTQLRADLEEIDKVLYRETVSKCMVCEERNRTVTLPCNHFVLCGTCAQTQSECPYCQGPIHNHASSLVSQQQQQSQLGSGNSNNSGGNGNNPHGAIGSGLASGGGLNGGTSSSAAPSVGGGGSTGGNQTM